MDGLRPARRNQQAHHFAEELIANSHAGVRSWHAARLGPMSMNIGFQTQDHLATFIREAFLTRPADAAPTDAGPLELVIARAGELDRLPPMEWAREWIDSGSVIAQEITYPYRIFIDRQVGIVYVLDQKAGRGVVWIRRESELDLRSFITPFRLMLSWMANLFDGEVVHASAAVVDGMGIAMSGASGSGKSTLAIALGLAGHGFIADDCVLIHGGRIHAVYARAKLDDHAASLIGSHRLELSRLPNTPRSKGYFQVDQFGAQFVADLALASWVFPTLSTKAAYYRLAQRRAYRRLSVDSLREVFGGSTRNNLRLAASVRGLPSFRVLLSTSMAENIDVVREMAVTRGL
jgi:hypothetical protein